ncbi:sulfotransferase family protein [Patiriisocius hiemis]|uniref:Sulfotransferase n=1 Tax=Patiriisocius hiemis TaxID=3075604 RepID=A0ABU2YCY7_9FLAO|nr:sulfotransferase [Constantimarinum sp. W242]MDT0556023.1 sulfotransferase [Constantimarinum sp. W242]
MKESSLLFIISQPRSGSTFLQRLISNNEFVNTTSEPWVLLQCASILKPELLNATFSNTLTQWAFNEYKKGFPTVDFQKIEKEYILSLYQPMAQGYSYVIDKTPRYWELINEIPQIFPNARIIILKRNPEDVVRSMMKTWQLQSVEALSRFQRDLLLAPAEIQNFLDRNHNNDNIFELKYEDLMQNLSDQTKTIYNWLQLPYNDTVLDIEKNNKIKGVFGDPYQNSSGPYKSVSSVNSNYQLSKKQEKFISAYLKFLGVTFLNQYGYANTAHIANKKSFAFEYFKTLHHRDHYWVNEEIHPLKKKFFGLFNKL